MQWKTVLSEAINELHTSACPIHSQTLQEHYQRITAMHLDLAHIEHALGNHVHEYKQWLEQSLSFMLHNDRASALTVARYLHDTWLTNFQLALESAQ